ncbi:MFS general substrate transporter [Phlegmacium glaucopus]|nr:MFS general substrate transporter [Phlegmacium glaucopus]
MGDGPAIASKSAGFHHLITDSRPWYKISRILQLNLLVGLLLITSSADGYDDGFQVIGQWENAFHHQAMEQLEYSYNKWWTFLIQFIETQNIGALAAYPFSPYLTDGLGRRPGIFFGASVMIVGTIPQTVSHLVGMFIGARFLIGFGLTFATAAAPLLVTEIAFPTQRAQTFGTFRIPTSWAWRLPSVIQVFFIWFVPESSRWLVSKGRYEAKALKTLAYYHANGNANDPLVQYEFEEIKAAIDFDKNVASNIGWFSLFKTPGNRRRMRIILALAFFGQWSGNDMDKVFIALGIVLKLLTFPSDNVVQNGILNIFKFIVAIVTSFLCERVVRRRLFLTSTIACFAVYSQTGDTRAAHTVIAMIFLFYGFCE